MNIKIGDKVKFLNDVGGGKVIRFIDKETVTVLNADDFEIPSLINELLVIGSNDPISGPVVDKSRKAAMKAETKTEADYFKNAPKPKEPEVEDVFVNPSEEVTAFLAIVPTNTDLNKAKFDFYIINDSNYSAYFQLIVAHAPKLFESRKQLLVEANTKEFIGTFTRDILAELNDFFVQMFFFKERIFNMQPAVDKKIKLNPTKLFKSGSFTENDFFDENALLFTIVSPEVVQAEIEISAKEIEEAMKQKNDTPVLTKLASKEKNMLQVSDEVIDLHIHELVDNEAGLENKDKLEIQLKEFHARMEEAIQQKKKKIVFIHGVGNGVLKNEVRKLVEKKYKFEYQDASFAEYGYGATLVFIPQNLK
ncbi:MAG TPA: hypothetical protein DCQ31_05695 [Bacteroidales bacterium]|nr:hypothetical protein [Bacteroidales bacterium]